MLNLFRKKKKFKASCDLSGDVLEKESAYVLSTAQIISSKKFWDNKMTEPETLTYTEAHFKSADPTARNIRGMIFKKYANEDKAWIVSDAHIHLFDVDEAYAKQLGNEWWDSEGQTLPDDLRKSLSELKNEELEAFKSYAVEEAGRRMVQL